MKLNSNLTYFQLRTAYDKEFAYGLLYDFDFRMGYSFLHKKNRIHGILIDTFEGEVLHYIRNKQF